jgi:hypothetical protein
MRIAVVLDRLAERSWTEIKTIAERAESHGIDSLYLRPGGEEPTDALLAAASLATVTSALRLTIEIPLGKCHPVHLAEKVAVTDNCLGGRAGVVLTHEHAGELAEAARILTAALRARPFTFEGQHWTIPARRQENIGARWTSVRVTPAPVQPVVPVSLAGPAATQAASASRLAFLGEDSDNAADLAALWRHVEPAADPAGDAQTLRRAAIRRWPGADRIPEIERRLRADQDAFGLEEALLVPPGHGTWNDEEFRAIRRQLWPRVQLGVLPVGLTDFWQQIAATGAGGAPCGPT